MNKIIEQSQQLQTVRICYGNDFSLSLTVCVWNADTSAWDKVDLSAAQDVEMFLVAQNGKRIKTTTTVDENSNVIANIPSTYLSKTLYAIEITFKLDNRNRRTYSPGLIQIVNDTDEAGFSTQDYITNDAYHFDIKVTNDVAWLNIGQLPSEYVTEDELADVLTSYVTNSYLSTTLDDYATKQYVDDEIATIDLSDYYTKSDIDTTLESYGTSLSLEEINKGGGVYAKKISLLNSDDTNLSYIEIPAFSYQWHTDSNWVAPITANIGLIRREDVQELHNTKNRVNIIESDYITSTYLNSTLVNYVNGANYDSTNHLIQLTHDSAIVATIDAAPFIIDGMVDTVTISNGYLVISFNTDAGKQDISIPISDIFDANDYYTKMQVDDILQSYVTATALANASYVTSAQLNNAGYLQGETDPIFSASAASGITSSDISSWNSKQDGLVSGTNIKTINNESILGSGNITIQGGGDVDLSAYVTYLDWDNSNEAIAKELLDNRLEHQTINSNFSNYYTKTESDGRYATQSWANDKFVTQADDVNRQQAIAAAFASSVQSTTVHNIWTGSQNDYDAITTKDTNTLYIIL